MGWEVQPEGLTRLLRRVAEEYSGAVPLYVTENGVAYDDAVAESGEVLDAGRVAFLRDHVAATLDAIEQGVDVRGYFYWSLMDNYEWAWGYAKRFGIVRVDYDTQQRTVKESGREYARIIAARAV
jgi:beta-glucosidase